MYPELNIDLARHQVADRLRRAQRRTLIDRQLNEGRSRQRLRWRGGRRVRRASTDQ